jgi:hypothetical protein
VGGLATALTTALLIAGLPVSASAVLGGTPAQGDPSVVQIRSNRGVCSAAFWQPQILITAAHCVTQTGNTELIDPASLRVFPPGADVRAGAAPVRVREIYIPDVFVNANERVAPHDISFLILDQPLGSPAISRLATDADLQRYIQEGRNLTHVGYGEVATRVPAATPNRIEQRVEAARGTSFFTRSTSSSGPCQGDSGSPVLVSENGELILVGVLSGGSGGCLGASVNPVTVSILIAAYQPLVDQSLIAVGMTGVPTNVRSIGANRELTVFWEQPVLNTGALAAYEVLDGSGNLICQVPAGVLSCAVPDRPNGVYDLRVISVSKTGYRATSEPVSVVIGPPDSPGAPRVKKRGDKIRIAWDLPNSNSATLTSFTVKDTKGKLICRVPARDLNSSQVSCTVPMAKVGSPGAAFRVTAESSLGRTEPSPRSNKVRS